MEVARDLVPVVLRTGENYTGCFNKYTWKYSPPGDSIRLCVDADDIVAEDDEANNCLTALWAAGDVNCDGKVNMGDVGLLHNHVQYGYPLSCCSS